MDRGGRRSVSISVAARPPSPQRRWSSQHHPQDVFRSNRSVSLTPNQTYKLNTQAPPKERTQKNTTPLVQPTSSLLQSLIKERRAHRGSQNSVTKSHGDDVSTISGHYLSQEEDAASEEQNTIDNTVSASFPNPAPMGLRETDEYISKITKLNFDLKLQVWHREQQVETLTKKLHHMQGIEERIQQMNQLENDLKKLRNATKENQSLKESNSELKRNVGKRDQAVTEAVELICQLEARVEELEARHASLPSTPQAATETRGTDFAECALPTPESQTAVDVSERRSFSKGDIAAGLYPLNRALSFLKKNNKNTATLRSLCNSFSHTTLNTWSRSDSLLSDEIADPASPRLSALSECSEFFPESPTVLDRFDGQADPVQRQELDSAISGSYSLRDEDVHVESWTRSRDNAFQIGSPKQSLRDPLGTTQATATEDDKLLNGFSARSQCRGKDVVYGNSRLPPTPDTMSSTHEISAMVPPSGSITGTKRQRDGAFLEDCEAGRSQSPRVVPSDWRRSIKSISSEDARSRVDVGIDVDIPLTPCMGTHFPLDQDFAETLAFDVEERPSTSSMSTTFEHRHIRPTASSHSLCDENYILNREGIMPLASTARKRRFTLPSQMPASDHYTPEKNNLSSHLETEDWLEAAKQDPASHGASSLDMKNYGTGIEATDYSPTDPSHVTHERIPSQFPFPAHQYVSKTEPLHKESSTKDTPKPERRRRLWLSRFFRRSRRAEPSLNDSYPDEENCSAPSPVIRKTRCAVYLD